MGTVWGMVSCRKLQWHQSKEKATWSDLWWMVSDCRMSFDPICAQPQNLEAMRGFWPFKSWVPQLWRSSIWLPRFVCEQPGPSCWREELASNAPDKARIASQRGGAHFTISHRQLRAQPSRKRSAGRRVTLKRLPSPVHARRCSSSWVNCSLQIQLLLLPASSQKRTGSRVLWE